MSRDECHEVVARVEAGSKAIGLDIVHAFNLASCDWASFGAPGPLELARPGALGLVVGNTRALWPHFVRALSTEPELRRHPHPLDHYVTRGLSELVQRSTHHETRLIFAHVTQPAPFPIARLAERAGLVGVSPSHLAIHPLHGPWLALRAVIVVDVDGPRASAGPVASPCAGCLAPCVPALARAVALSGAPLDSDAVARHARDWIAVRDACPVGRASRYGAEQLAYHYEPAARKLAHGS